MKGRRVLAGVALFGLLAVSIFPLYWALVSAFTPEEQLFQRPSLFPRELVLDHFRALFSARQFWTPVRNSLVVAGSTTVLAVVLGSLAAYAITRLRFRWKGPILALMLAVSMFPQISLVSPLYLVLRRAHLINTYPGLVLPYVTFALPLAVWLLVSYFRELPGELEEAAMIDGASRWQSFGRVFLPLAAPGIATSAILVFVYCWNEFLFALSFTVGPERQTVPVAIALFRGQYQVPWGQVLAAALVATVPIAAMVLLFQRRIVQGLTAGAVKG